MIKLLINHLPRNIGALAVGPQSANLAAERTP
jgi:hypothetical protein